ncbi:PQQ-binding-like beta-propeller repeat protein [Streptomyces sp. KL116D]|uniref:outer membrane protein assembly factor BamB family protein n=1 Tax=Streptomyces sp. KL116D TaxID=3045152 RepID=UPI0035573C72
MWREQRDFGTEETGVTAAVHGDRLVHTDFRKNLTVRDTATGKQVWTQKTNETNFKGFAVHDGLVILAQGRKLQAFALSDGARKWTLDAGRFGSFKQPGLVDGVLYVADSSRTLWAVQPKTGAKIWQSAGHRRGGRQDPLAVRQGGPHALRGDGTGREGRCARHRRGDRQAPLDVQ